MPKKARRTRSTNSRTKPRPRPRALRTAESPRSELIAFKVTPEEKALLAAIAEERGLPSVSELIRVAINSHCELE